jgi:peroxiredoxin
MTTTRPSVLAVAFAACLIGPGCGAASGEEEDAAADTSSPDTTSDAPVEPGPCPGPPHGTEVGDVIEDHAFPAAGGGTLSLCDLRDVPDNRLLLIYGTAGWCTQCTYESGDLGGIHADYHDDGLEVLAVVFEDETSSPADVEYARSYRDYYDFPFPTVADPELQIGAYFDKSTTPLNMFVDLPTMRILDIQTGYGIGGGPLRGDIEEHLGI